MPSWNFVLNVTTDIGLTSSSKIKKEHKKDRVHQVWQEGKIDAINYELDFIAKIM